MLSIKSSMIKIVARKRPDSSRSGFHGQLGFSSTSLSRDKETQNESVCAEENNMIIKEKIEKSSVLSQIQLDTVITVQKL